MSNSGSIYRFGEFAVEPDIVQIRRARLPIHIEPKTFDLLLYLLEHRERFVGKGELLDAVWDGAFVTESALTRAVTRLRKVLGDRARKPLYVETLRGRGYRFCASVQIVICESSPPVEHHNIPTSYETSEDQAHPRSGRLQGVDKETLQLRRDVRRLREERELLKKALAIFSGS